MIKIDNNCVNICVIRVINFKNVIIRRLALKKNKIDAKDLTSP